MKLLAVIPARIASTRLPRKALREILGKPMVQRVYEAARSSGLADVLVATDSEEIVELGKRLGMWVEMTSTECKSGTDRVREVAQKIPADVYINVQGDEPLARPEHITALVTLMERDQVRVGTLMTPCPTVDVNNPNAVKVVVDRGGKALYFSRATIPYDREGGRALRYFKHLGFYAYRKDELEAFPTLPQSGLEEAERLEQLRFLENGIAIHATETPFDTVGVDTEEDLRRVEEILRRQSRA
ncbi:MAG TPA: 3-deoxy-manno-octulosonate cytidylyltransferase [Terriglobales bacterium]|nr:3-deoxy-manno-octulosonate cytidylyltransferase [Terriglobales bacterium]